MSKEVTIKIHEIAIDGLPDMENLIGRVAYIWDGAVVSGWPIGKEFYSPAWVSEEQYWEPSKDRMGGPVVGVTHWIEFPDTVWKLEKTDGGNNLP